MSDHDRVLDLLETLPPELPDPADRFEQVRRRVVRRRRQRIAALAVGTAAAVALVVPVALQLVPESATAPAGPTQLTEPGPGGELVVTRSDPITVTGTDTTVIRLGPRPAEANAVRIEIDCLSAGTFYWPDGASLICSAQDAASTTPGPTGFHTVSLARGVEEFRFRVSEGASWRVVATYVSVEVTPWGVNAKGETYGVQNASGTPDLIAVEATNGLTGYAYERGLAEARGDNVRTPEEALAWQEENQGKSFSVPVYRSDGETLIGEFVIGGPGTVVIEGPTEAP